MTIKADAHFIDSDIQGTSGSPTWQDFNYGDVVADPTKIQITTAEDLAKIGLDVAFPRGGDYELMNNIDLSDFGAWRPLCTTGGDFFGSFDGNRFTISGMRTYPSLTGSGEFPTTDFLGLFADMTIGATVENLSLDDCQILRNPTDGTWPVAWIGILAGNSSSAASIHHIHITNSVIYARGNRIGGMVGQTVSAVTAFTKCSAEVNFFGPSDEGLFFNSGLLVGRASQCEFTDCYAQGTFNLPLDTGNSRLGGIVGRDSGGTPENIFTRCYAVFSVSGDETPDRWGSIVGEETGTPVYTDNYFDSQAGYEFGVEDANIAEVNARTTAQMYQEATFVTWDFNDVWQIDEGNDYPTLRWHDIDPNRPANGEQNRTVAHPIDRAHLNGQTVHILDDGLVSATQVITGGVLPNPLTGTLHIGLQYISKVQPMKIDGEVRVKRIHHLIANVNESLGGNYGEDDTDLDSMVLRDSGDIMDTSAALHTGYVELPFRGSYDRKGDIWIEQQDPLPMHVLGIGVDLSNERI